MRDGVAARLIAIAEELEREYDRTIWTNNPVSHTQLMDWADRLRDAVLELGKTSGAVDPHLGESNV